jgi:two-component system sensor histidine kinase TctE
MMDKWRFSSNSLGRRLLLQLLLVAAVLSALLYLAVRSVANQAAIAAHDNILGASATAIAEQLSASDGEVLIDIPYSAFSMLGTISEDRVFYRIDSNRETITGYEDLPLPKDIAVRTAPHYYSARFRDSAIRAVAMERLITVNNEPVSVMISVAQTKRGQEAITARVANTAAALGIGFFLVAGLMSWLATRSTVRPLHDVAGAIGRRGAHDLRDLKSPIPSELAPLVNALNGFIARLRDALHRNETFMAEAAHHVRTPLATVRTQAEIAMRQAETDESRKTLRSMIRAVDESSRSATQLLDHAMITYRSDQLSRETFNYGELVAEVIRGLSATAELKDLRITTDIENELQYAGDKVLIECALHNMVDNAIKYSAEEGQVDIQLNRVETGARFSVCDAGRGLGGSVQQDLTVRFKRGKNVSDVVGSGLGLTIVEHVAEVHNGSFELASRQQGGTCAILTL